MSTNAATPATHMGTRRWESVTAGPANLLGRLAMPSISVGAYVFLYIPIIALVVYSFDRSSQASHWTGFTFHWYSAVFHDPNLLDALKVSAIVAFASATLSTGIGLLSAVALARVRFRGRRLFVGLLLLPLLTPEIVLSVAFLTLLSKVGMQLGYASLIAGHMVLTLPYATLLLVGAMSRIDPALEEAAADLGCGAIKGFCRVILPLLLPALLGAFLLTLTTSFQDVVMSNFVGGPTTTPLPVYVYGLLKTGLTPELNALGTMLVMVTVGGVLLVGARRIASFVSRSSQIQTAELDPSPQAG
ncbi:MAG TPA: ABC transporter permease [Acidimicrobiales bacterium]|jgi:ABC-type spermidine/putrescine transport system permease subunit II